MKNYSFFQCIKFSVLICLIQIISIESNAQTPKVLDIGTQFIPAGYMGCVNNINVDPAWKGDPNSEPTCYKFSYTTTCPKRWAGVYWTNTTHGDGANFGQLPGIDLSGNDYSKITFYAKGGKGGEVIEFGAFGVDNTRTDSLFQYKDLCPKTTVKDRVVTLENKWKKYTIELNCKDLSSVVGGFYWSVSWDSHPAGLVFYIDDIQFE